MALLATPLTIGAATLLVALLLAALACLAEMATTGPGLWENVVGDKAFTMTQASMSAEDPRVELSREFFGAVIALLTDMPPPIQVGDTLSALAGCGKRLSEDCDTRFNNVLNFQGEPHAPALDDLTQTPDPSA